MFQHVLDLDQVLAAGFNLPLGSGHGPGQPVHLGLEQVEWYRSSVVRLHEYGSLLPKFLQVRVRAFGLLVRLDGLSGQFGLDAEPNAAHCLGGQLKPSVQIEDALLDALDADGPTRAMDVLTVPFGADEVVEDAAMPTGCAAEDQPPTAATTEDRAAQVVGMHPVFLPGVGMHGQHVLDGQPELRRHQRLVLAFVRHALVADHSHVVGIAQHVEQRCQADIAFRSPGCRPGGQPPLLQCLHEPLGCPVAGGVVLKGPLHQRRSLRVDSDAGDQDAVAVVPAGLVAQRWPVGRTAFLDLGLHTLDDLLGQVVGVELGHVGHDVVEELAGR